MCKLTIKSFSVPFCVKKKKERTKFKKELEKQLQELENSLDKNNSIEELNQYNSSKNELEKIEQAEINLCSQKLNKNDDSYQTSLNLFLQNENSKMLTQEDKELCDSELSKEEILNSLKDLQNSKTPGTDGLPADFYKFFWIDISTFIFNSITYAMEN